MTSDLAARRLRHLYEISTLLTRFAGLEKTLASVVDVAARALPVRTAVLVIETTEGLHSHAWKTDDVDARSVEEALTHARESYAWFAAGSALVDRVSPPPSIRALPSTPPASLEIEPPRQGRRFVVLPLVVERAHVFGALQVESLEALDEADVFFVNAVTNQVAVAIHRQMEIDAAEARVRAQLDFTRAITGSLGEGIVAADENACISFMNPAAEEILGFSERGVLGEPAANVLRARRADDDESVIDCPLVRALETGARVASDDHAFVRRDERIVPVSFIAAPIATTGRRIGAVVAFRDVLAMKRSERMQRLLADCSAALGESLDPETMIAAVVGRVVPAFADACSLEPTGDAESSPKAIVVPVRGRDQSFGVLSFAIGASGRTYSNDDVVIAEEIARRTAIALENARLHLQTEKAVRDRQEILAIVSHDLRSPLNTIVMAVMAFREKKRRTPIDPDDSRTIDMIARAADRMSRLTRDLLDVSSIEANRLSIDAKPTRVAAIARDLFEALEATARQRSIELTLSQSDPTLHALCDPDRILQVLTNLVGNALKFTPARGRIDVAIEADGDVVRFVVVDTGSGISADLLPHVFERNRQAPETAAQGRGLGLFITKGIVEAHGGTIRVESEVGTGTAFEFCLPRAWAPLASVRDIQSAGRSDPVRAG